MISEGGKLIDGLATSDQEKLNAKNKLTEIVLTKLKELQSQQRDVIVAEAKGNWLQRSWRPILMLGFGFIVIYAYFIEPAFITVEEPISESLKPEFWSLLRLGIGGYIIGRSAEKVTTTVTQNADLPFLRKKDRDKHIKG